MVKSQTEGARPRFRHTERLPVGRLPVGSGAWLSPDRQGKGGEHRRRGGPEVREHRAGFWKSPGKGRWGMKGAGGSLTAKV